ncbi:MAG: VTT domain-containing protein [Myxococcales bacterium]|nr:VTT domain-containing protein [Myxococcales bacterium]MCB9630320.1 VTT domain-containing protein [Sandaracinaceae bacterium]
MTDDVSDDVTVVHAPPPDKKKTWRLILLAVLLVGLVVIGKVTGLADHLTVPKIREFMSELGVLGFLLYLAVFCLGELVHIPGMAFMLAAVVAYGEVGGGIAGFVGGVISVSFTFVLVRRVGGQPLGEIKWPIMRKVLELMGERPIAVVTVLRIVFAFSPVLNYALAMSSVRFREYVIGSFIGLIPWAIGCALFTEWLLDFTGLAAG